MFHSAMKCMSGRISMSMKDNQDTNAYTFEQQIEALDFYKIHDLIAEYFFMQDSYEYFLEVRPLFEQKKIQDIRNSIKEIIVRSHREVLPHFVQVNTIPPLLTQVDKQVLNIQSLGTIHNFLSTYVEYNQWIQTTHTLFQEESKTYLSEIGDATMSSIAQELNKVFDSKGVLQRDKIPELVVLDARIRSLIRKRERVAKSFISHNSTLCSSTLPTLSGDRIVIPIQASFKSQVEGILHGSSGSSQTVYMEVKELYESNNELEVMRMEEESIIYNLCKKLSELIRSNKNRIVTLYKNLLEFDILQAQYRYSCTYHGVFPEERTSAQRSDEDDSYTLYLPNATHPLIANCIPITISFENKAQQLILTGPNAGGKTVALKTLGLLVLMNQSGIPIPVAEGAVLPFFSDIAICMGDHQNLQEGESTFSSHLKSVHYALSRIATPTINSRETNAPPDTSATTPSQSQSEEKVLLLFDELCNGTDEQEGGLLAWAILDYLRNTDNSMVFVTTHSRLLKHYAFLTDGVIIAAMSHVHNDYHIIYGSSGKSEAIHVAKNTKILDSIIDKYYSLSQEYGDDFTELMDVLHNRITEYENKNKKANALIKKNKFKKYDLVKWNRYLKYKESKLYKGKIKEADTLLKELQKKVSQVAHTYKRISNLSTSLNAHATEDIEAVITDTNTVQEELTQYSDLLKKKHEEINAKISDTHASLKAIEEGDEVYILESGVKGIVQEVLQNNKYLIQNGAVRMILERDDIQSSEEIALDESFNEQIPDKYLIESSEASHGTPRVIVDNSNASDTQGIIDVDVRGYGAEDALDTIHRMIDTAILQKRYVCSIIHGKGTGALARAIHAMLKENALVVRYSFASADDGGQGKTYIYLT